MGEGAPSYQDHARATGKHMPGVFRVILCSPGSSPPDVLLKTLAVLFGLSSEQAVAVLIGAIVNGQGAAGLFSRDIAQTKANLANKVMLHLECTAVFRVELYSK